jgi:hypothetical protein
MKRALALLGLAALVMAARPGTEQQLVQQLNGQPARVFMPDGGAWGVFTEYDAGTTNNRGCMPLTGLVNNQGVSVQANVLVVVPLTPSNVCVVPSATNPWWDGGACATNPRDPTYGIPLPVGVPQYITPDSLARYLCVVTDAGFVQLPAWWAQ